MDDKLAALVEAVPTKATFNAGTYSDGSGPVVEVGYDTDGGPCSNRIWLSSAFGDRWIAFDYEHTDAVIAAIRTAADNLAALSQETSRERG